MVPTLVRQAKAGKMKYIIGDGKNRWDLTYVGNVAQAHLLVSGGGLGGPGAGAWVLRDLRWVWGGECGVGVGWWVGAVEGDGARDLNRPRGSSFLPRKPLPGQPTNQNLITIATPIA